MRSVLRSIVVLNVALTGISFSGCNQDEDSTLDVPAMYVFNRAGESTVNFSGQSERLDMLTLMSNYLKSSNTVGATALDADLLKDMFANENSPFGSQAFGKDLRSKCFQTDVATFESFMDYAATASQAAGTASNGVAGVQVDGSNDPNSGYRVDANGIEWTQVIEKGLMGAVFYYQAMEVYLSEDRMGVVGNQDVEEGENFTAMEHYFDEAFGYFGVPVDFPSLATLDDARFWGKYCNSRENGLYTGINDEMSLAFRTARAAISAQDYDARDAAIQTIMEKWSIVIAASAVDYLNQALSISGTPEYKRHHVMSEAIGFMLALKYHFNEGNSKFPPHYSYMHVEHAMMEIGLSSNLYEVTDTEIQTAIDHIKMAFPTGEIK